MSETIPYLKPLVIVDVETTGGSAAQNRLIEIGVIRIENGKEVGRFQSLINPGQKVPPFVQNLTGITDRALESAPPFKEIADQVEAILKDALFIGHNVRFDYDFVRGEFRRLERRFAASTLCSARFSRAVFPEYKRHNLGEIVERHGLASASRHRALDDAIAVWDFFRFVVKEFGAEKFSDIFEGLAVGRPVKSLIPPQRFENLPESAGVYWFRDAQDAVLYVGRSGNLREKILGHFYGDFDGPRESELIGAATDLEWAQTPGELSAFFLENDMIKKFNPKYARKPKTGRSRICAVKKKLSSGHLSLDLVPEDQVYEGAEILTYYRGFREAKQALQITSEKQNLCRKLLGLEKGAGPCSGFLIKKCRGACQGQELSETYNVRFGRAFEQNDAVEWPYSSAILIDEYDEETQSGEAFLVKNWLILARIRYNSGSRVIEKIESGLDRDLLKVLTRVMKQDTVRVRTVNHAEEQDILREQKSAGV